MKPKTIDLNDEMANPTQLGNDQNKPCGLLSDPTSRIVYLCKSD